MTVDPLRQSAGPAPAVETASGDAGEPRYYVKDSDLWLTAVISTIATLVLVAFGAGLFSSGLLSFSPEADEGRIETYLSDSLFFRERRIALSLTLRTFITGFAFIVGLALSTIGGVFILRQVGALTTFSASGKPIPGSSAFERAAFRLEAYSPGVIFLIGGVLIIWLTQYFAIPLQTMEVYPQGTLAICVDPETQTYTDCANLVRNLRASDGDVGSALAPADVYEHPDF